MAWDNRDKGRVKNWSLLVYIAGDDNLSDAGLVDTLDFAPPRLARRERSRRHGKG